MKKGKKKIETIFDKVESYFRGNGVGGQGERVGLTILVRVDR